MLRDGIIQKAEETGNWHSHRLRIVSVPINQTGKIHYSWILNRVLRRPSLSCGKIRPELSTAPNPHNTSSKQNPRKFSKKLRTRFKNIHRNTKTSALNKVKLATSSI